MQSKAPPNGGSPALGGWVKKHEGPRPFCCANRTRTAAYLHAESSNYGSRPYSAQRAFTAEDFGRDDDFITFPQNRAVHAPQSLHSRQANKRWQYLKKLMPASIALA
jgi:hypothetical protein